jgi:CheY-like chemotaxis protein
MFALLGVMQVRPSLVLAHSDPLFAASVSRTFCQLGWNVHQADTGPEARELARSTAAELVVLGVDLPGESGWLTCGKLSAESPAVRTLLICADGQGDGEFGRFVGAAGVYPLSAGLAALLAEARRIAPALLV